MENIYKVEMWGGDPNGAIRYYDTLRNAKIQAKRYVTRNTKIFGLSSRAFAEIYIKYKEHWLKLLEY